MTSVVDQCVSRIPRPGLVAMLVAALFFSGNATLAKVLASTRSFSPFQVLYMRGVVTCLGSSAVLLYEMRLPFAAVPNRRDLVIWAMARGVLGTLAIGALYFGVASLPLTESIVLYGFNPVFAMIFSKVFLDEPMSWVRASIIPIFVAGVIVSSNPRQLISDTATHSDASEWVSRIVVLFGSLCSGLAIVFARKMNSVESVHWAGQAWWQGAVSALLAPSMSAVSDFKTFSDNGLIDTALMISMGLCAFFAQLCIGYAIQHEDATVVGVLWNFDMVYSLMWQAVVFKQEPEWFDYAGVALVFLASALCVVEKAILDALNRIRGVNSAAASQEGRPEEEEERRVRPDVELDVNPTNNNISRSGNMDDEEETHDHDHHHHVHHYAPIAAGEEFICVVSPRSLTTSPPAFQPQQQQQQDHQEEGIALSNDDDNVTTRIDTLHTTAAASGGGPHSGVGSDLFVWTAHSSSMLERDSHHGGGAVTSLVSTFDEDHEPLSGAEGGSLMSTSDDAAVVRPLRSVTGIPWCASSPSLASNMSSIQSPGGGAINGRQQHHHVWETSGVGVEAPPPSLVCTQVHQHEQIPSSSSSHHYCNDGLRSPKRSSGNPFMVLTLAKFTSSVGVGADGGESSLAAKQCDVDATTVDESPAYHTVSCG